jgi:hypothetical protein
MRIAPFIMLVALGSSQSERQDARPLLRSIADASRNFTTFRIEGRIAQDLDIGLGGGKRNLRFRVATRASRLMRIEMSGTPDWMTGASADRLFETLCSHACGQTHRRGLLAVPVDVVARRQRPGTERFPPPRHESSVATRPNRAHESRDEEHEDEPEVLLSRRRQRASSRTTSIPA